MLVADLAVTLELGAKLDGAGVPWVVVGAVSRSLLEDERRPADIDVVAGLGPREIDMFCMSLGERSYFVPVEQAGTAACENGSFTIIHNLESVKVEIFCAGDGATRGLLATFVKRAVHERGVPMLSPEDLVLQKLRWATRGDGEGQLRDALAVMRMRWDYLDLAYLRLQAFAIGVDEPLARLESMR